MDIQIYETDCKRGDNNSKSDHILISTMLGQVDTIHLFDEAYSEESANNSWISSRNSVEETPSCKSIEVFKEYYSPRARCCDEESRTGHDTRCTHRSFDKICCTNEHMNSQSTESLCHKRNTFQSGAGVRRSSSMYRHWCLLSVSIAFGLGLVLGIFIPFIYLTKDTLVIDTNSSTTYQSLTSRSISGRPEFVSGFTLDDVKKGDEMQQQFNKTNDNRIFLPSKSRLEYIKSKMHFPTIHDVKDKPSPKKTKQTSVKLNKPKIFPTVSFVEDVNNNFEEIREEINRSETDTKDTLLKYLDLKASNESEDYFVEFGKKILANSLDRTVENKTKNLKEDDDIILRSNIYWGSKVENSLPSGFGTESIDQWMNYIKTSSAVKMETGCGRMQNRLVTFLDGRQACVRYRQNTDQIQGELFSFYLARLLNLPNLAPSLVSIVNVTDPLWQNVASDIGSAQWNSNRPVVMTKYIPNLEAAHIPEVFKPSERHLNKLDVLDIIKRGADQTEVENKKNGDFLLKKLTEGLLLSESIKSEDVDNNVEEQNILYDIIVDEDADKQDMLVEHVKANIGDNLLDKFIELAQWSDLIIFDYLTANLDRIVNNLYNFQWNVNIMDAPAHNLARKVDSNLLLFLDNESGLLHGYRLLNKYEVYHTLLLDNLCVFRKSTVDVIMKLYESGDVGDLLNRMFKDNNNSGVLDVLPPLPEKSIKILNERIGRVANQIRSCEDQYRR